MPQVLTTPRISSCSNCLEPKATGRVRRVRDGDCDKLPMHDRRLPRNIRGFPPALVGTVRWRKAQRNSTPSYLSGEKNGGSFCGPKCAGRDIPCTGMIGRSDGANSARRSFRSFCMMGTGHGSEAQARWWQRNDRVAAEGCNGDWSLRSATGAAVPYFSGGGENSTTTEFVNRQAELRERSPIDGDLGDRSKGDGHGGKAKGAVTVTTASTVGMEKRQKQNFLRTLWQFSRPHTMIGTAIAIPTMGIFAAPSGIWPGSRFLLAMVWAIVPSLLINIYITGLNQIMDVEIDRVNKPYLPIPAGNLSRRAAKMTVTVCLLAGAALGLIPCSLGSPALALTVILSVVIGTSYSLPPLRLKRFPQVATLCILVVRGTIINGGFYTHAQAAAFGLESARGLTAIETLTLPLRDAKCALALGYFTFFAVVIALMKDVPDVAGDRKFNIPSFSVVLGERALFGFARRLLTALLWSTSLLLAVGSRAAVVASSPRIAVARGFVAASALMSGQLVRRRAGEVDPKQPSQVYDFYMFLWKVFYASYLFLPLAR